jgi:hypothetical protein
MSKDGVVGMKVLARDLADTPPIFQLTYRRLHFGATVVLPCDVIGIRVPVIGYVGLHRRVELGPELHLLASITIARAHGDHAKG